MIITSLTTAVFQQTNAFKAFVRLAVVLVVAVLSVQTACAQSQVISYSKFVSSGDNADRVVSLANDLQSAVYVENGEMNQYGEHPVCLYTDLPSHQKIADYKIDGGEIEMAIIRITSSEQLRNIDFKVFSQFPKLKYIYISASIDISEAKIRQITQADNKYIVLFQTARQS